MYTVTLGSTPIAQIKEILKGKIQLSAEVLEAIAKCRAYLDNKLASTKEPIYGINTGFGALCNTSIDSSELQKLQQNLVQSHACGMGAEVPRELVKLMLLLKILGLSKGHSGVHVKTVQQLLDFYNAEILPVVYEMGSLGASGDLAPLAHISYALMGGGEVWYKGERTSADVALKKEGLEPLVLDSKEGLALLNGTQFMSAYGVYLVLQAEDLFAQADMISALSLDAFDGRKDPFYEGLHRVRSHQGQIDTAAHILSILEGSEILAQAKQAVQDPYSFRCIPQVHGASKDALAYVKQVVQTEIDAVTDNPTIFPDEDLILSGGNFHGQPLAIALDLLAISMAEMGNISERRTYQLISGQRGLPPFLVKNPGLDSGLMIPQYTAASMVSLNKQLCSPASADSIVSSNGQEDHVSMGANAATKALRVGENLRRILAVELLTASQAIEFRRPAKTSPLLEGLLKSYREQVSFIESDRYLHDDLVRTEGFLKSGW